MRQSKIMWLGRVLVSGVLLAGISVNTLQAADARASKSVTVNDVWKHRPANMFKMSENKDPSVCDPLLASLNEKKVITDHRTIPIVQNEFISYPWRQQKYSLRSVSGGISWTKSWEVAFLDLDGDGVKDGLFREEHSIKESPYHVTLFIPSIDSKTVSKNSLAETEFRNIAKIENKIYLKGTHRNINFGPNFLEIVTINRQNYLLMFSAFFGR